MAIQRDKVIASAEKLVAKGKIEPAIKEYERLLEDNPNDVNTLNRIGDLWVRINRNDEAVKVFGKIADHYARDGFFLKAIAIFKKINKLDPSKLDIYAKLADLYAKQGLAMEAKSQYQVLADYYLKHGDPGNALSIYRKISELDPNSINVHVKLADLYSQNNQTAEALKEYDRVGKMLLKRGMLDEAVQVFRKAMKIDAANIDLAESLVTALLESRDFDNSLQIIETSLEANRDNPRLLALLGKVYLAKGDANNARNTLERGLAANPNDPGIRETLAELYLKQGAADRAIELLGPNVEAAVNRNDGRAAVELLNRVLRADSGNVGALERLVAVYTRLNEETNILASMNSLAEAHIARGNYEGAATVLDRLIAREPQNAQHRNKLSFVHSQMGGVDTIPARSRTSSGNIPTFEPPREATPPPPSYVDDSISLDLDASEPLDLDFGFNESAAETPASVPQAAAPPVAERLEEQVELEEGGEDLDFITEHLTEAEVFAKYGLAEKAAEHLRAVIERAPKHATAHERLYKLLLDEGDIDGARSTAVTYVAILTEKGDAAAIDTVNDEFLSRGQLLKPARKAPTVERAMPKLPTGERPSPAATPTMERPLPTKSPTLERPLPPRPPTVEQPLPVDENEMEFDLEEPSEALSFEEPTVEEPVVEEPSVVEEPIATEETPVAALEEETISFEEPGFDVSSIGESLLDEPTFGEDSFELPSLEEPAFGPASFDEPAGAPMFDTSPQAEGGFDPTGISLGQDGGTTFDDLSEEPFFGVEADGSIAVAPAVEEIGEIDFYIEQELFEEAQSKVAALLALYPGNADLEERSARIDEARAAQAAPPPPPAMAEPSFAAGEPPVLSRAEIDAELLSAIPDDDDDFIPTRPAAPVPPSAPAVPMPTPQEENLFADEDDFFDLAAELEEELAEDEGEMVSLSEEEQSLEEIFKEFKKGVEQQLDAEDYDTHYNLGIAYKEMGLIDEAIGEFQLASKDPKRAVECASMLGLCFLEKGMPQLAIKWYRKGIEMPEITEDEHVGLLYDLGSAYLEVGDTLGAQKAFMEVYGMNTNYRDIVSRIKQLEDVRQ
jgi:pilus assembly protein FimV